MLSSFDSADLLAGYAVVSRIPEKATTGLRLPRNVSLLLASVLGLLALVLLWISQERSRASLEFVVESTVSGSLQVFFEARGAFNESMSKQYPLSAGEPQAIVLRKPGPMLAQLRIDPPSGGEVSLCGIRTIAGTAGGGYILHASSEVEHATAGDCLVLSSEASAPDPRATMVADESLRATLARTERWTLIHRGALLSLVSAVAVLLFALRGSIFALSRRFARIGWLDPLDRHAHRLCAALMLLFGTLYALHTPPGAVPDEAAHLAKVVKIHAGAPFGGAAGERFPDVARMYGPFSNYPRNKQPLSKDLLDQQLGQPVECTPTSASLLRGADPYFPHHYALATASFAVACATESSFGTFLYSARLVNLLIATLLVGIGVAFAGRGKWALAFIALLPMSLFQVASLSADSLVIGASIAWIGVTSGLASGRAEARRVVPLLWVLALVIALLKPGAAWILASLLFCGDAFRRSGLSFLRGLACFVVLPWMLHAALALSVDASGIVRAGVDSAANLQALKDDPPAFLRLLWNTFSGDHGRHLYRMMIGVLGWIDVPLSGWAYAAASWALLTTLLLGRNEPDHLRWHIVAPLSLMFTAGSILLISLPLYIKWTLPDAAIVEGLQGRYFLPSLAFAGAWVSMRSRDPIRLVLLAFVLSTSVALNLDAFNRMHQAYFVIGR